MNGSTEEWFRTTVGVSKANSAGHSTRKMKTTLTEKAEWTGMDFTSSTRAAEDRIRQKGIVVKTYEVPQRRDRLDPVSTK